MLLQDTFNVAEGERQGSAARRKERDVPGCAGVSEHGLWETAEGNRCRGDMRAKGGWRHPGSSQVPRAEPASAPPGRPAPPCPGCGSQWGPL